MARRIMCWGLFLGLLTAVLAPAAGTAVATGAVDRPTRSAEQIDRHARPSFPKTFVGVQDGRLGVFSSKDGAFVRYLTDRPLDLGLPSLTPNRTRVLYLRQEEGKCVATHAVRLSGGRSRLVRTGWNGGGAPMAAGPKGALAGNTACLASMYLIAKAGNGRTYRLSGTRDRFPDALAWAPDAKHLAVATGSHGVVRLDVTKAKHLGQSTRVPCPRHMPGCFTRAPDFAPDGTMYYVAINAAGVRARVVRLRTVKGTPRARALFTLPRLADRYTISAANGGHLLISAYHETADTTESEYVLRWDGTRLHHFQTRPLQVDW